ncbi:MULTISPECIES: DUF2104 domain-containing protein [unclassified Methanopyrus]|uniref:DUF2104 domain-containing protein n=1 Tax=Methanopyrus sp. SNP6 TaxID=1937005 RepID=UPI0011E5F1BC|nr:energy-converting hydrogenase subunit EhaL family protein [Methanopyrus sp. SNP6]
MIGFEGRMFVEAVIVGAVATFLAGSLVGLEYSYRMYPEIFRERKVDPIGLLLAILGWTLLAVSWVRSAPVGIWIAAFLIGYVVNMRPGYGRVETALGIAIFLAVLTWLEGL